MPRAAVELLDQRRMLTIQNGSAVLTVTGTAGNDNIYAAWIGSSGSYTLRVSDGSNVRDFAKGSFTFYRVVLDGNNGDDTITAANTSVGGGVAFLPVSLVGDGGADTLYGSDSDDKFTGGSGNDSIYGYNGEDAINGDDGNDFVDGGGGNDTISGGIGDDLLAGGANGDTVNGDAGNDQIDGGSGTDSLSGGTGADLFFSGRSDELLFVRGSQVDGVVDIVFGNARGAGSDGSDEALFSSDGEILQES